MFLVITDLDRSQKMKLELDEIQGIIGQGYGHQKASCFLLLRINDPIQASKWLEENKNGFTYCNNLTSSSKLNIALSYEALKLLGLDDSELAGFSRPFVEGMVTPHRQRILGDLTDSASDPAKWEWGGVNSDEIHVLLMVYETNSPELKNKLESLSSQLEGFTLVRKLASTPLKENKEHFGFRDGISQPIIREFERPGPEKDQVAAGEFILGYDDESKVQETAPKIGTNGSYLVFRQIVQNVSGFWEFFQRFQSDEEAIFLASKMVGRWPDGTPLTVSPNKPTSNPVNTFNFSQSDPKGINCPLGSHIRRSNPRDGLLADPIQSTKLVNRHRILRRGRTFGMPPTSSVFPGDLEVHALEGFDDPSPQCGLYFLCFNANIERQFEFIQHTWLNGTKFSGLRHETDPISSTVDSRDSEGNSIFTIQGQPFHKRIKGMQKYIHIIGGAYFFLPSKTLISLLACGNKKT